MNKFNLVKNYHDKKRQDRQLSKLTRMFLLVYFALFVGFGGMFFVKFLTLESLQNDINELRVFVYDPFVNTEITEIDQLQAKKVTIISAIKEIDIIKDKVKSFPVVTREVYLGFAEQGSHIETINYIDGVMNLEIVTSNNSTPSLIAKSLKESNLYEEVDYFGFRYDKDNQYYIASYSLLLKGGN